MYYNDRDRLCVGVCLYMLLIWWFIDRPIWLQKRLHDRNVFCFCYWFPCM